MQVKRLLEAALLSGAMFAAVPAFAEGPELHYAQAGATLAFAEAEVKVLFGAINAREFDPAMTRALLDELKRLLEESKRRVDRASALLDEKDQKLEPELAKVREAIKKAEGSLEALGRDIEAQTGGAAATEEGGGPAVERKGGEGEEAEEAAPRDWDLLKNGAGWLGADLKDAQAAHAAVARKLKLPALPFPPKPKAKRS